MNQSIAFTEQNAIFKYLESVSNYAALTPAERDDYEAALMRVRDDHAILMTAKEKAMAEGLAEGRAEGEKKERRESIRIMLSFGISTEQIAKKYNISVKEVEEIANSI